MSKLIHIVDDEPAILELNQLLLEMADPDYEVEVFDNASEVLDAIKHRHPNLILSDFRMPNMTGSELLDQVRVVSPETVRILMSGYVSSLDKICSAHQYLAKPWNPSEMREVVARSLCAQASMADNPGFCRVAAGLRSFPVVPGVYRELIKLLNQGDYTTEDILSLLAQDGGIISKLLHLVNTPMFGAPGNVVTDPGEAVIRFGTENLKAIILCLHVFESFDIADFPEMSPRQIWDHCWDTALYAEKIARMGGCPRPADAFLAGMLHDMGRLVLMENNPEQYRGLVRQAISEGTPLLDVEARELKLRNTEITAFLIRLWGLPEEVAMAIQYHDHPWDLPHTGFSTTDALYAANGLATARDNSSLVNHPLNTDYLRSVNTPDLSSLLPDSQENH